MHEFILKMFFEGTVSASELATDLKGSLVNDGTIIRHHIVDMEGSFEVRPAHLVKVCDAVLSCEIEPEYLNSIGFCLIASDAFFWDDDDPLGEIVAEVSSEWSVPEINYSLTLSNVAEWRHKLLGEARL